MKRIISKIKLLVITAILFVACNNDDEKFTHVDLRYNAEDRYELGAMAPNKIEFQVKSNYPWTVESQNGKWCEILPASGDGGEELVTVSVQYLDNDNLDDREDVLVIKSDYWTGKCVEVVQSGTAYLNYKASEALVSKVGDDFVVEVIANQKWSVEVDPSVDYWLKVISTESGDGDGEVTLSVNANAGEQRSAKVYLLDRHGVTQQVISVNQDGIVLNPKQDEVRVLHDITTFSLEVESDARWSVEKDDVTVDWYDFVATSFNGNATLEIVLKQNASTVAPARVATFTIFTDAQSGVVPVRKKITIRQAYFAESQKFEFDQVVRTWTKPIGADKNVTVNGDDALFVGMSRIMKGNNLVGRYDFYIKSMNGGANPTLVLSYDDGGNKMVQFDLLSVSGKTSVKAFKGPGSNADNIIAPTVQFDFDNKISQKISVDMVESQVDKGYTHIKWLLNDQLIFELESTKWMDNGRWGDKFPSLYVGTRAGEATFDCYEYTPPIEWE